MKAERDMRLTQDADHKLHMLKVDTADAKQRAKSLTDACQLSIQKWATKVAEMQTQVRRVHQGAITRTQTDLFERYLVEISEKNKLIQKLTQRKQAVESKILSKPDEKETNQLTEQLNQLIFEFQRTIGDRVEMIQAMIEELKILFSRHDMILNCNEDTERVKNAIEIAHRDIYQKRQVTISLEVEVQQQKSLNAQLDKEIEAYQERYLEVEDEINDLDQQLASYESLICEKDAEI